MPMGFAESKEHCKKWGISLVVWETATGRHRGRGA